MNGPQHYAKAASMAEHVFDQKPPDLTSPEPWGEREPAPIPVHDHAERLELLLYALVQAVQANTAAIIDASPSVRTEVVADAWVEALDS